MKRLLPLLLVAACSPDGSPVDVPSDPVVVYAAFESDEALIGLFERYRAEAGVTVVYRFGPPRDVVDDLIRNDVEPPADVLLTRSAADAWRAAEESALRPMRSGTLDAAVPEWARDADYFWYGLGIDPAVVASAGDAPEAREWTDLAGDGFAGRLCLSTSKSAVNRAVIAASIAASGEHATELAVRGWVKNLAEPPFESEIAVAEALAAGRCEVAVLSRSIARRDDGLQFRPLSPRVATVDVAGIGRHARNEQGAARFIEWLIEAAPGAGFEAATPLDALSPARFDEDARKLAERARFH